MNNKHGYKIVYEKNSMTIKIFDLSNEIHININLEQISGEQFPEVTYKTQQSLKDQIVYFILKQLNYLRKK